MDAWHMQIKDIIEIALEREVMARRLYEHLASVAERDEARMMLLELVSFEAEHVRIFTRALDAHIQRLRFDTAAYLESVESRPFTLPGGLDARALQTGTMEQLLPVARKFETSMAEFYGRVAQKSPEAAVREAALRLEKEELSHGEHLGRLLQVLGLSPDLDDAEFHAQ